MSLAQSDFDPIPDPIGFADGPPGIANPFLRTSKGLRNLDRAFNSLIPDPNLTEWDGSYTDTDTFDTSSPPTVFTTPNNSDDTSDSTLAYSLAAWVAGEDNFDFSTIGTGETRSHRAPNFVLAADAVGDHLHMTDVEPTIDDDDGADTVQVDDSNDTAEGDDTDDTIHAGDGDDTAEGDDADDTVHAGDGDETAEGDDADDTVHAGDGDETAEGDDADDAVQADDTVQADDSDDTAEGDDGDDTVQADDDTAAGDDADDTADYGAALAAALGDIGAANRAFDFTVGDGSNGGGANCEGSADEDHDNAGAVGTESGAECSITAANGHHTPLNEYGANWSNRPAWFDVAANATGDLAGECALMARIDSNEHVSASQSDII